VKRRRTPNGGLGDQAAKAREIAHDGRQARLQSGLRVASRQRLQLAAVRAKPQGKSGG